MEPTCLGKHLYGLLILAMWEIKSTRSYCVCAQKDKTNKLTNNLLALIWFHGYSALLCVSDWFEADDYVEGDMKTP